MKFKTLFRYRGQIMGLAMLMLLAYHAKPCFPESIIKTLVSYFYCGVDIFIFTSGVGCWFAYKNSTDALDFLRRRALRIFPVLLPFIFYVFFNQLKQGDFIAFFGNVFFVQWLTDSSKAFNWYMSFLWISYLLTPWFFEVSKRNYTLFRGSVAVLALLVFSFLFWTHHEFVVIAARMPLFLVGMLFAASSQRREELSKTELILVVLLIPVGFILQTYFIRTFTEEILWAYGTFWYGYLLMVPGVCALTALVCEGLSRYSFGRMFNTALGFVGKYTLETFLLHCYFVSDNYLHYIFATVINVACLHLVSVVLRRSFLYITHRLRKDEAVEIL